MFRVQKYHRRSKDLIHKSSEMVKSTSHAITKSHMLLGMIYAEPTISMTIGFDRILFTLEPQTKLLFDDTTQYRCYQYDNGSFLTFHNGIFKSNIFLVMDLQMNHTYKFEFIAMNPKQPSSALLMFASSTFVPPTITKVSTSGVSGTIQVEFAPLLGIFEYILYAHSKDAEDIQTRVYTDERNNCVSTDIKKVVYNFSGLPNNKMYTFRIVSVHPKTLSLSLFSDYSSRVACFDKSIFTAVQNNMECNAGTHYIYVENGPYNLVLYGGGGGGAGSVVLGNDSFSGGGGGGGGYSKYVVENGYYILNVGKGGKGGGIGNFTNMNGADGGDGGNTSIFNVDDLLIPLATAKGGSGRKNTMIPSNGGYLINNGGGIGGQQIPQTYSGLPGSLGNINNNTGMCRMLMPVDASITTGGNGGKSKNICSCDGGKGAYTNISFNELNGNGHVLNGGQGNKGGGGGGGGYAYDTHMGGLGGDGGDGVILIY